ncbi:Inosine-5'-monophosphate dehydrogenase [Streptomyces sp. MBT84]|uniref:CBS domain-containing protein n=1 Tax=unclassified Streptomyces TaxID=2593676 RepID=UPI000E251898|nr:MULTISPECIES: CBS domain-containing protein [unclassified Streptomyces]MBW8706023.1 Inosine-5'-monophosphate dehydrogenase [Streptomyces sp. MBT84]REE58509.1 CBS domain protein [Streptomyces sp. 3212.3]
MTGSPHLVDDVMTHSVVAVGRAAPFKDIVRLMEQWQVSALPVLEGEGRVVGVVSEADLLPKEEFRDTDPDRYTQRQRLSDLAKAGAMTAEELMSAPAVTVHPGSTLAQAARIMARLGIKRLPVVDGEGMLEGVVSRADLLKVFLRPDNDIADEVRRDVVDILFPAPAEPVHVMVTEGVVTITGKVPDAALIPVAVRLARAVEGVVDVDCHLSGSEVG